MRNLLRASQRGSINLRLGNGSMPNAASRVRRKGMSKELPLWAIQMSYRLNSATIALRTAESSDRHRDQSGLSLSARKTLGFSPAPLTTPQRITPKSAERLVVSRSSAQQVICVQPLGIERAPGEV